MKYHDEIITITLCRGEIAATLGEDGLMVRSWSKLKKALAAELVRETPCRGDGHTGSSAVGDLLLERLVQGGRSDEAGITVKPDSGPNECWPEGKSWFDGSPNS